MDHLRVLPSAPILDVDAYVRAGGGRGLDAARLLGPTGVIEHLLAAGLRGRGGAGFPTGRKWAAVQAHGSSVLPTTVVVNAAEGEPGSFKDRALLRRNPFAVLEGALIAAETLGSDRVIVAVKASFVTEAHVLRRAILDAYHAGWTTGVDVLVFEGPGEYLYGEETALLEAIDGRPPFPRVAPPYRHGVEEVATDDSGQPAQVVMADTTDENLAPPTLINNVETMANIPGIMANGPSWFREQGTDDSPGTIVCTVTGCTRRHGVGEFPMGTPLRTVIDEVGGGPRPGRHIAAVMSGVANPVVPAELLDTPVSYEAMEAIDSGLGAAGFIVFDDTTDFAALGHGVSTFLAVESCGQCTPCKEDGLALAEILERVQRSVASDADLQAIDDHLATITDGARCFLAHQHQRVIRSLLAGYGDEIRGHIDGGLEPVDAQFIAPIRELDGDEALLDEAQRDKQPDWTFEPTDSGKTPAERLGSATDTNAELVRPVPLPPSSTDRRNGPAPPTPTQEHNAHPAQGVSPDSLDPDDAEASLYTSEPLETDHGTIVIQQQAGGKDNVEGGGEWPDPDTPPQAPAPGAR